MFLPFIFHRSLLLQYSYFSVTHEEPWKVLLEKGRGLDFYLIFSHLWWDLLILESVVYIDQFESEEKRENANIYQIHSLPDSSICMCRSITRSGVGNFCSASLRFLWGYLATTNVGFSSAGCNLAFLAEQGTGTAELEPCSKSHGNFIPSSLPLSERKETQGSSAEM